MNKRNLFFIILFLIIIPFAGAVEVAYIVQGSSGVSQNIVSEIEALGLEYDIILNSQIVSTNFGQYEILVVGQNVAMRSLLPLQQKNSVFLNKEIAREVWNTGNIGVTGTSRIRSLNLMSFVFEDVEINPNNNEIIIYQTSKSIDYLRAPFPSGLINVAVIPGSSRMTVSHSTKTVNGEVVRTFFFGAHESNFWSDDGKQIFSNGLQWVAEGLDNDGDGWKKGEDCNDNDDSIYPGADEIPYDGIDQDCDGHDFLDVDGDGFCAEGFPITDALLQCPLETGQFGTDCDDNDFETNLNSEDLRFNCVNDSPRIIEIIYTEINQEGEEIVIEVIAEDPEDDELYYSINSDRFEFQENYFTWLTDYQDAGEYSFEITVSDGENSVSEIFSISVLNVNFLPMFRENAQIEIEWDEDTQIEINFEDYFYDVEGETLFFGISETSELYYISYELIGEERIIFSPGQDYFGEEIVILFAENSVGRTNSEEITLRVLPVNDAPKFFREIENITFLEDENPARIINLNDYFMDIDSELEFSIAPSGSNTQLVVEIDSEGYVSFSTPENYFGDDQIVFAATDGEFIVYSNLIEISVLAVNDAPVFLESQCETEILEDTDYNCVLEAFDEEGDEFYFQIVSEDKLYCSLEGNVLSYRSFQDYFGEASCEIEVSDGENSNYFVHLVNIENVNDAPIINEFFPADGTVRSPENIQRVFSILSFDSDSDVEIIWRVDGEIEKDEQSSSSEFEIAKGVGIYVIEAIVSDEEFSVSQMWILIVGSTEEFTCAEVGGHICPEAQLCAGSLLSVSDSNSCCASTCAPSFSRAEKCEINNEDIRIEISDYSSNEKIELGSKIRSEFRVYNDISQKQTFDVYLNLYDVDKNRVEQEAEARIEVDSGNSRLLRLDMDIPPELELQNRHVVLVTAKSKSGQCNREYKELDIKRPDDLVVMKSFEITPSAICSDLISANVDLINYGTNDKKVTLEIVNSRLGVRESREITLEEFGRKNKGLEEFEILLPSDIPEGEYDFSASLRYGSKSASSSEKIVITCSDSRVEDILFEPQAVRIEINEGRVVEKDSDVPYDFEFLMSLVIMNIVLICAASLLYLSHSKRKGIK